MRAAPETTSPLRIMTRTDDEAKMKAKRPEMIRTLTSPTVSSMKVIWMIQRIRTMQRVPVCQEQKRADEKA
jgi:hypothetical protein